MKTIIPLLLMATTCQAQTIDQVRAEIHRQGLPHANIVLAQARLETGNFRSERCKRDKNLFGSRRKSISQRWSVNVIQQTKEVLRYENIV